MPQVEIYTADYCPYCTKAKNLLTLKGIAFTEIDVTGDDAARAALVEKSGGRRTVPQIFIDGKPVGGCDDLYALNEAGGLKEFEG
ncbi:MAG: glutaredoxin 3 [Alphaproteobacteria bacterium]|nr:glutaredoxin 3 [Alphaproteobacteria bacterium]